jgi:membrane protein
VTGPLRRPWIRHLAAAWERLRVTNGNLYAAAITFFSFLALFPLLLLAVSVLGFVLHAHPDTVHTLFEKITKNVPGQVGKTLQNAITTAIDRRTGIGVIGLIGVVLTGLGWIGNLRAALDAIWKRTPPKENPVRQRLVNLGVLALLGGGVLVSIGLTAGWAAFTHEVLHSIGLDNVPGMGTVLGLVGIAVTLIADAVIFFLVLVRLPRAEVSPRVGAQGALLAAAGFEVLKIVGTYTVAATAHSATAGPFAGLLAVLIWIQLVTRWMLFCAAWTAEKTVRPPVPVPVLTSVEKHPAPTAEPAVSPAAVGAGLVGVGAVAGSAVTAYALRHRHHSG